MPGDGPDAFTRSQAIVRSSASRGSATSAKPSSRRMRPESVSSDLFHAVGHRDAAGRHRHDLAPPADDLADHPHPLGLGEGDRLADVVDAPAALSSTTARAIAAATSSTYPRGHFQRAITSSSTIAGRPSSIRFK